MLAYNPCLVGVLCNPNVRNGEVRKHPPDGEQKECDGTSRAGPAHSHINIPTRNLRSVPAGERDVTVYISRGDGETGGLVDRGQLAYGDGVVSKVNGTEGTGEKIGIEGIQVG